MSLLQRFSLWISKDPMQRTLYILVPIAHIVLFIGFSQTSPPKKINAKKLVVKTFSASASQPTCKTVSVNAVKKVAAAQKKPSEPKKTPPLPTPKTKKIAPPAPKQTPQPVVVKKEKTLQVKKHNAIREEHLKELEERIAKIEAKSDRITTKSELAVPSTLVLNSPQALPEFTMPKSSLTDEDFAASLIGYLQAFLHLPELGEVQMQLTLRKDGKVENMKVIAANSEKNKKYLEEQLPKLSFPQAYLDSSSSRSFLLTFCNKF